MTLEQKRKGLIAKIKIAQSQLKMDDDVYRALLMRVTGQNSCKNCNLFQLQRVMAEMERLGFVPTRKHLSDKRPLNTTDKTAMMDKLAALLATSGKSWAYANGMAKRMFQKEQVNYLNNDELHRLIAALNYHVIREQAAIAAKA